MVEVVTAGESISKALAIAGERGFEQADGFVRFPFFKEQLQAYFPEFEGFSTLVFPYEEMFVGDEVFPPEAIEIDAPFMSGAFATEIAHNRQRFYEREYREATPAVIDEVWELLSFGASATAPSREAVIDLGEVWDFGLCRAFGGYKADEWAMWMARFKTGTGSEIWEVARDEGIDLMVGSYLSGVPAKMVTGGDWWKESLF